ncbi:TRAP transporter small permease [Alkalicoccus urumqiensis]|uniref:TRAP transporter small permease n=1 Tax=Alkalicoccus urumqiensis TaxID=1548213 RepID=A0A2P6MLP7_ALKUR|nr:TRAP transporter small permease [Alkalicoccus urumqiensis]PRO67202.1 TRAP transporter small permease [Alkalicoccus urumqiensis]
MRERKGGIHRFVNWTEIAAAVLLAALTTVVTAEVAGRYLLNQPIAMSNELTQLLFPWMIYVAAIAVTRDDAHLSVSYFRDRMPYAAQKGLYLFSKAVMLIFSLALVYSSWLYIGNVSSQVMPVMRISRGWLSASVTLSFLLVSIILIYQIVMIAQNKMPVPREEDQVDAVDHDR